MEMFVNRVLSFIGLALTSHARYELLEIETNSKVAIETYEAVVMGRIL